MNSVFYIPAGETFPLRGNGVCGPFSPESWTANRVNNALLLRNRSAKVAAMMTHLMNCLIAQEAGQDTAEYGLVLALIAIAAILALTMVGGGLPDVLQFVANIL